MIQSIERAIDVLFALRDAPKAGLFTMEIARKTGLSKATCYNILKTLKAREVVDQEGNGERYTLSRKFFSLTFDPFSDAFLVEKLTPAVAEFSRRIGENVSLVALRRSSELE